MRRGVPVLAILGLLAARPAAASAEDAPRVYRFDPKGRVRAVRTLPNTWVQGPSELVVLVDVKRATTTTEGTDLLWLQPPRPPSTTSFYEAASVRRIPCDGEGTGEWSEAGAVALARGGIVQGGVSPTHVHFLGTSSVWTSRLSDTGPPTRDQLPPALFSRSPGSPLVFWDGVVRGEREDELWYPRRDGGFHFGLVDRVDLEVPNEVARNDADLFQRDAKVPTLQAADVDGDGKKELVALVGTDLVVWSRGGDGRFARSARVPISFLAPDPKRPPEEIRTPRINVADADGDGKADLLVTLVQGRADKVGGLRTSLYRFPGPFFDPKTGALVEPQPRIDTESVALHPRFVDVDGDGKLDYVADSIRGSMLDLIARVMGREPTIWHTIFRFDGKTNAYEKKPWASVERPYSSDEAKGNTFGRSGFFEGDFDGDGVKDLLDLGNLTGVTILAGTRSGEDAFTREILPHTKVDKTLKADAVIADLDGDGRSDAVLWNDDGLVLVMSGGPKKDGK